MITVNATSKAWTQFDVGKLIIKIRINEEMLRLILKVAILRFFNLKINLR